MLVLGIIFVTLAGGQEVPVPASRYFTSIEQCQERATANMNAIRETLGGVDARFTCEVVAE